jgi:hypothetical protein
LALVKAKQDEHITSLDVDDRQDKFETIIKKMEENKKICDYKACVGNNQEYWSMTNVEKSTIRLP